MKFTIRYNLNFEIFVNKQVRRIEHNNTNNYADLMHTANFESDGYFTPPFTELIQRCLTSQGEGDEQNHQY